MDLLSESDSDLLSEFGSEIFPKALNEFSEFLCDRVHFLFVSDLDSLSEFGSEIFPKSFDGLSEFLCD
jgi:hypothetical protein